MRYHIINEMISHLHRMGLQTFAFVLEHELKEVQWREAVEVERMEARCSGQCAPTSKAEEPIGHGPNPGDYVPPPFTSKAFVNHIRAVWDAIEDVVEYKDAEYGEEEDTFATVKHIAAAWAELPREVALKLALKHYMSLLHEGHQLDDKQVRERINDIHVYLEIAYCNWEVAQ